MSGHPRAPNATLATTGDEAEQTLLAGSRLIPTVPTRELIGGNE
jgi:hypothetical protein